MSGAPPGDWEIPFNRVSLEGDELEHVRRVVESGQIGGNGAYTKHCEELLARELGAERVMLTTSGTHALEMAALLLDVGPGDEVILPSFTFVSTANAFVLRGATPVFADVRPDTLNLDEQSIEGLVTDRTRCTVPVHYAGIGSEMDAIAEVAERHGLSVVEDNAHGLFARYRGRCLGTFGAVAAQSFHATKNLTCGEGGALVINDPELVARAEVLREKGTDRTRFFRGEVDKYTWVDLGSSYVTSEILAAYLWAQLQCRHRIQERRREIWERYRDSLADWASGRGVQTPEIPAHCEPAYHMFFLVLPTPESRNGLIARLQERGILAVFHYLPLHLSRMGRRFGGQPGQCPVTESVSERLVRLPFFNGLGEADQDRVIESVQEFEP